MDVSCQTSTIISPSRHEVVNVNTWEKPEWFKHKNPKELVPVLEKDDKIVYESIIASEYLDAVYPEKTQMMPEDPYQRAQDAMLLDHFGSKVSFSLTLKSNESDGFGISS